MVDLHGMIDNEVDRDQRLDHLWILSHALRDAAHRGKIAQQRNAGEIL